jgi:hemolysin activation/secretion protein
MMIHPCCPRAGILQASLVLAFSHPALAQVPDAGRALRDLERAAPAQLAPASAIPVAAPAPVRTRAPGAQPSFVLQGITFKGNTVLSNADLQALVASAIGTRVTYDELKELAGRVTAAYHAADYLFTDTIVPAQEIVGGMVELSVLEGRLGRTRIERIDTVPLSEARLAAVAGLLPRGRPLMRYQLERTMLMLSDTPGIATQSALETGDEAGTVDLVVEVKAAPRISLAFDLDNQGSPSTGRWRAGMLGRVNSPLGLGDNLDLRVLSSFGKGLLFGRLAYEVPVGASGLRAIVAAGHIQYELGADFSALDAHGTADVVELGATYPFVRSRLLNLFGKAGVEYKRLDDRIDVVAQASVKHVANVTAGLVYERRDRHAGGGFVSGGIDLYRGRLDLRSAPDRARDQGLGGRDKDGAFARATYQLSRLQYLSRSLSAYLAVAGQWSNRNLDSAEKIAGGGPRAVRAFSTSTGIGDTAAILNAEIRWGLAADATMSAFYDIARVRANRDPAPGEENRITLGGAGLGLYKVVATGTALRASVAWPRVQTGEPSVARERGARVFGQLVKAF